MQEISQQRWYNQRIFILLAVFFLQFALGAANAWPTLIQYWAGPFPATQSFPFLDIAFVLSAIAGGFFYNWKTNPRTIATIGGVLYSLSFVLAAIMIMLIPQGTTGLLVLCEFVGGFGLGLSYIVSLALLVRWFPDKMGLVVGSVLALPAISSYIVIIIPGIHMITLLVLFIILGLLCLLITVGAAQFFVNPPASFSPPFSEQTLSIDVSPGKALLSSTWYQLWWLVFVGTLVSFTINTFILIHYLIVLHLSTFMIGILSVSFSLATAFGRFLWGWLSDYMGRPVTFLLILGLQILCFIALLAVNNLFLLFILIGILGFCAGGSSAMLLPFAADIFGVRKIGAIYGLLLSAWLVNDFTSFRIYEVTRDFYPTILVLTAALLIGMSVAYLLLVRMRRNGREAMQ